MGVGLIISDTQPTDVSYYTWLKINPDGSKNWYEWLNNQWTLVKSEAAPASADHSHSELGDINFTGEISVGGDSGITGSRTIQGHTITFKKGILTGFSQA